MEVLNIVLMLLCNFLAKTVNGKNEPDCALKYKGICVSTASEGWSCPIPDSRVTPRGCQSNEVCCVGGEQFPSPVAEIPGNCGIVPLFKQTSGDRIIDGWSVPKGRLPWQVLLRSSPAQKPRILCGASIIDKQWVVTAAHCFDVLSPMTKKTYQNLMLTTGAMYVYETEKSDPKRVQVFTAENVILHEKYLSSDTKHDIALVKLTKSIRFDNYSAPICLPAKQQNFENMICTASGWGVMSNAEPYRGSANLRAIHIPVIPWKKCYEMQLKKDKTNVVFKDNICALLSGDDRATCTGDSGGPLACRMNNGQYVLAGIMSWADGDGCGLNLPGVLTKVSAYIEWIEKTTGIKFRQ